jgi:hypothetical protein
LRTVLVSTRAKTVAGSVLEGSHVNTRAKTVAGSVLEDSNKLST